MAIHASVMKRRQRFGDILVMLSFFGFIASIYAVYYAPLNMANKTYMSENALAPNNYALGFGKTFQYQNMDSISSSLSLSKDIPSFIAQRLRTMGLETHSAQLKSGVAVFGVIRAPGTSGTNGILISSHWSSSSSTANSDHQQGFVSSVSMAMVFAEYIQKSAWVSKDIYILLTPSVEVVSQWLEMYHGLSSNNVSKFRRSGCLEQAIHLDFSFREARRVVVEVEGKHLPNLDMFNAFVRILQGSSGVASRNIVTTRKFFPAVLGKLPCPVGFYLQFAVNQALGFPQGSGFVKRAHSAFVDYGIDSITVSTIGSKGKVRVRNIALAIEGLTRSLLGLQEKLHQSFYFYLLPSILRYISIGDYMITFGLSVFPLIVKGVQLILDPRYGTAEFASASALTTLMFVTGLLNYVLSLWYSPLLVHGVLTVMALGISSLYFQHKGGNDKLKHDYSVQAIAIALCTLWLATSALVNYPLAMFSAWILVPHVWAFASFSQGPLAGVIRGLLLIILDPVVLTILVATVGSFNGIIQTAAYSENVPPALKLIYFPLHLLFAAAALK